MCKVLKFTLIIVQYKTNHQNGHVHRHSDILFPPLVSFHCFSWVIVICLGMIESYLMSSIFSSKVF